VHLTNVLVFYFEALLYVLLDCALSLLELDDNLVALGATFRITLVKPILVEDHWLMLCLDDRLW
jgi:hypothetical protein